MPGIGQSSWIDADVDDPAAATLGDHLLGRQLDTEERALEIDRDDHVELVLGRVERRGARLHPGVVDEDVEPPERRHGAVDQLLDVGDARDVRLDGLGAAAGRLDLLLRRVRRVGVLVIVDRDRGTLAGELDRDRAADPAVAAGDDGGLAVE